MFHILIKTQIGHSRDFAWYRGQRPPLRALFCHTSVYRFTRAKTFATLSSAWVVIVRHFNHARRGRALAAISGKVPSVSGMCIVHSEILITQSSRERFHISGMIGWFAIWPMFVVEYFPQFRGNWKWLPPQSVSVHPCDYGISVL